MSDLQPPHPHPQHGDDASLPTALQTVLRGPLLRPPVDFAARVMAALPAVPVAFVVPVAPPAAATAESVVVRVLRAALLAAVGAGGAVEVLSFVAGLWTASAAAFG